MHPCEWRALAFLPPSQVTQDIVAKVYEQGKMDGGHWVKQQVEQQWWAAVQHEDPTEMQRS